MWEPQHRKWNSKNGAFIIHILSPKTSRTFQDYVDTVSVPYIKQKLTSVGRVDLIWDVYDSHSLKATTRQRRDQGQRRTVLLHSPVPKNWSSFLHNEYNRADLFALLAKELAGTCHFMWVRKTTSEHFAWQGCLLIQLLQWHSRGSTALHAWGIRYQIAAPCSWLFQETLEDHIRSGDTNVVVLSVSFAL